MKVTPLLAIFFSTKMSSVGFRSGVSGEMCVYIDLDGNCLFHNIQRELLLLHADSDDDFYHSAHLKY